MTGGAPNSQSSRFTLQSKGDMYRTSLGRCWDTYHVHDMQTLPVQYPVTTAGLYVCMQPDPALSGQKSRAHFEMTHFIWHLQWWLVCLLARMIKTLEILEFDRDSQEKSRQVPVTNAQICPTGSAWISVGILSRAQNHGYIPCSPPTLASPSMRCLVCDAWKSRVLRRQGIQKETESPAMSNGNKLIRTNQNKSIELMMISRLPYQYPFWFPL